MSGYGNMLADFYQSTSDAARADFNAVVQVAAEAAERVEHGAAFVKRETREAKAYVTSKWKATEEKIRQKVANARRAVDKKLFPKPAGATIQRCPKNRKAERVAERKSKIAGSKERLKTMPPGKQRDALEHATTRFERNNIAVERARLAEDVYNVGEGDPPEGWERVSAEELKGLGMNEDLFPQLADGFRPSEYKDGYYPELYRAKPDVFGEVRYVLAFRGTQGVKDGAADVIQAFGGETDQYTRAVRTAQALKRVLGDKMDITGHSMGGGMAAAAGIITGLLVCAIDPAGVHPATLERVGKEYTRKSADRYVQNYIAEGEFLDTVQNPTSQRALFAGITSVSQTGGLVLTAAGHRSMAENGTITYGAAGPVHRLPVLMNAADVVGGKTQQGMSPGLKGKLNNQLNPLQKVHLHDPCYVIAGIEQQKADDLNVIDRGIGEV